MTKNQKNIGYQFDLTEVKIDSKMRDQYDEQYPIGSDELLPFLIDFAFENEEKVIYTESMESVLDRKFRREAFRNWLRLVIENRRIGKFDNCSEIENVRWSGREIVYTFNRLIFSLIYDDQRRILHYFDGRFHSNLSNLNFEFQIYSADMTYDEQEECFTNQYFFDPFSERVYVEILDNSSFSTKVTRVNNNKGIYVMPQSKQLVLRHSNF